MIIGDWKDCRKDALFRRGAKFYLKWHHPHTGVEYATDASGDKMVFEIASMYMGEDGVVYITTDKKAIDTSFCVPMDAFVRGGKYNMEAEIIEKLPIEEIVVNRKKDADGGTEMCDRLDGACIRQFEEEHKDIDEEINRIIGDGMKSRWFRSITERMNEMYEKKNHDYGDSFGDLFRECGMTYAYGHLREKLNRIKSLMDKDAKVKNESIMDSLLDLANYSVMTMMEIERNKDKEE